MIHELLEQIDSGDESQNLQTFLLESIKSKNIDTAWFASAYASVEGIQAFQELISAGITTRWLIGLDDYFTHPQAIKDLLKLRSAEVRVVHHKHSKRRIFHPKIFILQNSQEPTNPLIIVGSSNLTLRGLQSNIEASTALIAESQKEATEIFDFWEKYWTQGRSLKKKELEEYETKFKDLKERRKRAGLDEPSEEKSQRGIKEILGKDTAELLPEKATTCWIEVGKITGGEGTQLEIKAEQARYFRLDHNRETSRELKFVVSNNNIVLLRFTYQQNSMWRLQFNQQVPEVQTGLRKRVKGKLLRSEFVAVFTRQNQRFKLEFIKDTSSTYKQLIKKSRLANTWGQTTARQYGWI